MGNSKTVSALLVGLFVGAAAGILLAPHKGSKTRRKIWDAGEKLLSDVKDRADELGDRIKDGLNLSEKETAQE